MTRLIAQECLILQATEAISQLMAEQNISARQLALSLGRNKGYVTDVLTGRTDITLRALADILYVLGHEGTIGSVKKKGGSNADNRGQPDATG